jgi:hypothetical protein
MHLVPILIVFSVAIGLSVFALDFYKNRHRLSQPAEAPRVDVELNALDTVPLDEHDLQHGLEGVSSQVIHSVGTGLGHLLEGLSHH